MHRFAPIVLAAALLLPTVPAAAEALCQTPNGPRSQSALATELQAVGYPGPWNTDAMSAAYSRASGGSVTCGGQPAPDQGTGHRTIVVEIGGYESSLDSSNWNMLEGQLRTASYSSNDFFHFSYAGWEVPAGSMSMSTYWYETAHTCNSITDDANLLTGMLRFLRDHHWSDNVALVGHSLGGVVAVQALMDNADLTPFVRSTITIDSPFGGINGWFGLGGSLTGCTSLSQLGDRRAQAQLWQDYYAGKLPPVLSRGARILAVVNPADDVVGPGAQCICELNVNRTLSAPGHSGVFTDWGDTQAIAQFIGPQGQ